MAPTDPNVEHVTVFIVDDHDVVLKGLRFYLSTHLDVVLVGEARDAQSAVEGVVEHVPDVVLIPTQERRRQAKVRARLRKRHRRQAWKGMRDGQTSKRIRPTPRAGSYLVRRFWEYFGLTEALEALGIRKFKGLAAGTLILVALLFGVLGAQSVSDLTDKARADQILMECCTADMLERKQLYRFLGKMTQEQY